MTVRQMAVLTAVFVALVILSLSLQSPFDAMMMRLAGEEEEFRLIEQLSKYLLLLTMASGVLGCRAAHSSPQRQAGIALLLFGALLYFGDSNFINEKCQPLFGAVLTPYVLVQCHRARSRLWTVLLVGCGLIGLGLVGDLLNDRRIAAPSLPGLDAILRIAATKEDLLEVLGTAWIAYGALGVFRDEWAQLVKKRGWAVAGLLVALAAIAVGNGFLHHQYSTGIRVRFAGLVMSLAGVAAVYGVNTRWLHEDAVLLPSRGTFYYHLFLIFGVLPSIYEGMHSLMNLVVWGLVFLWWWAALERFDRLQRRA